MAAKYGSELDEVTSGLADLSLPVTVLSWNINGLQYADTRRRMLDSVVSCIDPDVMLLQETKNSNTNPEIVISLDKYNSVHAGDKEEAQVLYKKNGIFEIVSPSTVSSTLDTFLEEMFPKDETRQLRSGLPPAKVIRDRICVVHLRHKLTKREIIFISYHNIRKGGGPGAVSKKATEVCQIIAKLHESTNCCVIAGVDFNCSNFDATDVTVPCYAATSRRQNKSKVDYFILKNPPVDCGVEAFDLFPENEEAPFYEILQSLLLLNSKEEYDRAIDHDPLTLPIKIRKHKLDSKFSDAAEVSANDGKIKKLEIVGTEASYTLTERSGNLFSCPESESLAHCISADVRMGKGIAVSFKTKFGGVDELKSQGQKPGGVAILRRGNRHIYYLVTKERYFHKPTYQSLQSSLQAMKGHCVSHGVTSLSMPTIGCGLDRLQWPKVRNIIEEVFKDTDINITVYSLPRAK